MRVSNSFLKKLASPGSPLSTQIILTTTLSLLSLSSLAADSCSCGYQDQSTNLIWTDSIITYFNETSSASDINFNSTTSPVPNEFATSSPSKVSGSQDWVVMSYRSNWDACWSCIFRHQIASNNTYVQDGSLNLAVQPADMINHISWGGEVITHRRDILYGSFRAALQAPAPAQGGTIFEMGISYNLSDYLSTGIYSSDNPDNSTFQWSYSSSGHIAAPTKNPLFALGSNGFHEHRMDWMGSNGLRYSNDGTNASANFLDLERKRDHINIPTLGGPLYLKHWSNGERSQSQGPPIYHQPVGKIQYVRLFFNSSLPSRHLEFRQRCSAAPVPLCSTEDYSLRDSTPFSVESTGRILASPLEMGEQLYAVISLSLSGGFFFLLLIHALVNRSLKAKRKEKDALVREQQKQDQPPEMDVMDEFQEKDEAALKVWEDPSKLFCQFSSDYDSLSEDSDDESDPSHDLFHQNRSENDFYSFGDGVFNQQKIGGSSDVSLPYSAPSARSSSWYGGVVRGIPSDNPLVSASQARLISRRTSSHIRITEEEPALMRWNPIIVDWKPQKPNDDELQLAQRADGVAQLPQTSSVVPIKGTAGCIGRFAKRMLVGEGAGGITASGTTKIECLNGLRGLACFLVSFHHFMLMFYYNVTTASGPAHYPEMERWLRNLFGAILTNGGLNIGMFFVLAARVIANRYLVRGNLQDLAEATQRRVPRLLLPISFAILLSYFLGQADAFHWVERLSSRSWSTWPYYDDYDNIGTFIDSWLSLWFTHPPNVTSMISTYPAGILWTVPLIVSSSWTVFTCALIACEIPNVKKRYCFYFACWSISWYVLKFDYFFIAGLIIADLDDKVKYRGLAARGFPLFPSFISSRLPISFANKRIHGQVFAWAIFLTGAVVSWLDQVNGSEITLSIKELGIHPHWQTAQPRAWFTESLVSFTDPRIFDFFFVIGFFLLCDLCLSFRTFFQLRIWSALGRNAFSLYLLHGVIFWSWGAWICLHLLAYGVDYWVAVLVTLITSYIWLAILCEVFSRTFDKWGVSLSKSFWRECSGGLGSRD